MGNIKITFEQLTIYQWTECRIDNVCINAITPSPPSYTIPTIAPTTDPTVDPTTNPTIDPTVYPTMIPSFSPFQEPTSAPSQFPSQYPTINPITLLPTTSDLFVVFEPTFTPTTSYYEGKVDENDKHTTYIESDVEINDNTESKQTDVNKTVIIILCSIISICFVIILFGALYFSKKRNDEKTNSMDAVVNMNVDIVDNQKHIKRPNTIEHHSSFTTLTPKSEKETIQTITSTKGEKDDVKIVYDGDKQIEIKSWLESSCGDLICKEYFEVFISNGFQSLDFIKEIQSKEDLKDIGICKKGHQTKILAEIKKIRQSSVEHHS